MYKKHSSFQDPSDLNQPIWRYLDFAKFVSFLISSSLHFSRPDRFNDPFEGSTTIPSLRMRRDEWRSIVGTISKHETSEAVVERELIRTSELSKSIRQIVAVNCWHMNEVESAAMWSVYARYPESVALRSTYSRLCRSFTGHEPILVGAVNYIDYERDIIDKGNFFNALMCKRKSFEHEREVRAMITRGSPFIEGQTRASINHPLEHGADIPVSVHELVESVYVAPGSPTWFRDVVETTVAKFEFSFPVFQSDLSRDPIY